ncbi:DUF3566 domain-containing protein [Actinoplanes derwentensis]|uniref:DUF3566 domain-containing protein n=1 Tax=Actinoplanes derwentensis TaxID=113562 RepID=A0A1H2CT85_9ACTN|nr:DUF3566 domain-containing protein [Actinoplanes derwentensis]GID89742.1 hypothetical protein Ade03nite_86660 [Actinoplanes derwentensis]SDT73651.1 Transmembrane protein of unknown function [Actinoplanes derwentensis]
MPETQAKSGGTGTSATPDDAAKKDAAAPSGRESTGRASVPTDSPTTPKFTRAPGMAPPPGEPAAGSADGPDKRPSVQPPVKGSASVPVVTKGKGAAPGTTTGRAPGILPGSTPPGGPQVTPPRPVGASASASAATPGAAKQRTGGSAAAPVAGGAAAVGAARVSEAVRSARSTVSSAAARGPRRARLNLKRIDPWSVMKFAFAVSIVLFIVVVVATSVLYLALDTMGVWSSVNGNLQDLVTASGGTEGATTGSFRITAWGVIGTSMLIGAVNVVLFTALATLSAFIYNVCADLVGGIELTLAERD